MKRVLACILAGTMVVGLAACGSGSSSTATSTAEQTTAAATEAPATAAAEETTAAAAADADASGEQVTLRFSWWGGDDRHAATLEVIDQFEKAHPNIKIEPEYGGSDGYADKLATQLGGGNEPDIIQLDPAYMSSFVAGGDYFVDLLADGFDFSQFDENYIGLKVNGRFDGRQLGIPTGISGPALLLNQQLVDELQDEIGFNFDEHYTWDDLIEWGRKVHEYDESLYLVQSNKDMLQAIVLTNFAPQVTGTTYFDDATGELIFTKENWMEMYELIQKLYENNVIPPASYMAAYSGDALQTDPNWIAGKYVGVFCHNSLIANMTAANDSVSYTAGYLPVKEGAVVDGWKANCPQLISVSSRSAHIKEAEEFLDYFFNDPTAQETLGVVRSTPATSGGREICEKIGVLDPVVAKSASVFADYTNIESDMYSSATEVQQIIRDEIEAIGYGVSTPESAAEETVTLMEEYIDSLDIQ